MDAVAFDDEMMRRALDEARAAIEQGAVGVASVLTWRSEIVGQGHNAYAETCDLTAHAEMSVLRAAARRLDGMSAEQRRDLCIYITLEPCLMCLSALSIAGIPRAVYAALIEDASAESLVVQGMTCGEFTARLTRGPLTLVEGIRRDEGRELLRRMGQAAEQQ